MKQYTMDLTILSLLAMGICCVSGRRFDQLPSNATAMEGGSANFSCTVLSENSSTVNSIWRIKAPGQTQKFLGEHDDVKMTDLNGSGSAFIRTRFNSLLTIANVTQILDGTQVICYFINKTNLTLMPQEMPYAFLTVQWPPVLSSEGMNISLLEGESDTFSFTVDDVGNPRSTMTITGPLQPGNPHVSISFEGVGNISRVSRNDAGTHTATWRNDAGSATFTLDLNVIWLDDLILLNGTNISATVGDDVVIEIGFNANPMPNFTVTYVSTVSADQPNPLPVVAPALGVQSVDSRLNISGNILKLSNVTENDTGIYTVEGRNLAGIVSADFNWTVRSPPTTSSMPTAVCDTGCIIGSVLAIIAFIVLVIVVAVVILECCICCERCICYIWCNKCRQKESEDEDEDKGISLT